MNQFDDYYQPKPMVENVDYYLDPKGFRVMTEKYHKERGYCCGNGCRHCPYFLKHIKGNQAIKE